MEKFWDLLEHVLNTVLFTLGGVIWGTVAAGYRDHLILGETNNVNGIAAVAASDHQDEEYTATAAGVASFDYKEVFRPKGREWGYLFLLYVFVLLIRGLLITVFYPLVSRTGLKSNWQESIFMRHYGDNS